MENKVEITKAEARELVDRCLKVLYYRDARSYNRVSSSSMMLSSSQCFGCAEIFDHFVYIWLRNLLNYEPTVCHIVMHCVLVSMKQGVCV